MKKIIVLLILFMRWPSAFAGEVISNLNGKVLINTNGEEYKLNQKFYIYNPETQRKIGKVTVIQKRRDKSVVAEIISGTAIPGALVELAVRNITNSNESELDPDNRRTHESNRRSKRYKNGISISLLSSQLAVKTAYLDTTMRGTNFGVNYIFQIPLHTQMSLLGGIGIHPIKLSGTTSNGLNQNFNVNYFNLEGLIKYIFNPNQTGVWFAMGGGFNLPQSKSSNVLDSNSISSNYSINFAIGNDISTKNLLMSLKFEYAIFPGVNTSTTRTSFSQMIFGVLFYL
jgi:hypothetical protein